MTFTTRCLGGTLLVIKGANEYVSIERDYTGQPKIVETKGNWSKEELMVAMSSWKGSEAERR